MSGTHSCGSIFSGYCIQLCSEGSLLRGVMLSGRHGFGVAVRTVANLTDTI